MSKAAYASATPDHGGSDDNIVEAIALSDLSPRSKVKEFAEVRAPSTLLGGYELTVELDGCNWIVLVPEQGVQEGELFRGELLGKADGTTDEVFATKVAAVSKTESDPHGIPTGHWRDGLCDCCAHGLFHIHYWMAYFCRPVALGQILSRMNLSIWGEPLAGNNQQGSKTLSIMIVLTFLYWTLGQAVNLIGLAILFFTIFVTMKARAHVRRTYNIPESRDCIGCEDFCCSFWCGCCVLAQMSRHTVDYRMYHPVCCTESGMDIDAPPTIPKDPIVEVNADIV